MSSDAMTRIDRAYRWWTSSPVMDVVAQDPKGQPSAEQWDMLKAGLSEMVDDMEAPEAVRTAYTIACDPTCRSWGMIEVCFFAALHPRESK